MPVRGPGVKTKWRPVWHIGFTTFQPKLTCVLSVGLRNQGSKPGGGSETVAVSHPVVPVRDGFIVDSVLSRGVPFGFGHESTSSAPWLEELPDTGETE